MREKILNINILKASIFPFYSILLSLSVSIFFFSIIFIVNISIYKQLVYKYIIIKSIYSSNLIRMSRFRYFDLMWEKIIEEEFYYNNNNNNNKKYKYISYRSEVKKDIYNWNFRSISLSFFFQVYNYTIIRPSQQNSIFDQSTCYELNE